MGKTRQLLLALAVAIGLGLSGSIAKADGSYYAGKTVTIIVGYPPGGGYASYATLIARHFGRHIPGAPSVIVKHMPGAASIVATNHLYNVAKPDGLTIGSINMGNLYATAVAGSDNVQYDLAKMDYIGNARSGNSVLLGRRDSYPTLESLRAAKKPVVLGISQRGDGHHLFGLNMQEGLGIPFNFIAGYGGGGQIDLALERKEIDVRVANWNSYLVSKPDWITSGFVRPLVQSGKPDGNGKVRRDPRIKDVPTVPELFPGNKDIQQIEDFSSVGDLLGLVYIAPPGTPKDLLKLLQDGFMATLTDPAFLKEAKGFNLEITPMSAQEVEAVVKRALMVPPEVVERIKRIKG
jgi:tripartite-type tricarboxylate transporter receptor subunit TctC